MRHRRIIMRISSQRIPMAVCVWPHRIVLKSYIQILDIQYIKSMNACLQSPLIGPPLVATEELRSPELVQYELTVKFIFPTDVPRSEERRVGKEGKNRWARRHGETNT